MNEHNRTGASKAPSPSPASDANQTERRVTAWIGRAVRIEGKVISAEDLVIDGRVDGSIELSDHNLTIGAAGAINASLYAKRIVISGTVTGDVTAMERLELRETGTVTGDITTPQFVMAEGATVVGKVDAGKR